MALAFIFQRRPTRQGRIGTMLLDVTIREQHTRENRVTQWPVEDGSTITDHINNQPRRVTIEGFITDAPLLSGAQLAPRAQNAFIELERMWQARELLEVVTQYRRYSSMAIQKLDVPKNPNTGQALRFTVDFVEVQKANSETVEIPQEALPAREEQPPALENDPPGSVQDQAQSPSDTGRQTAPAETPQTPTEPGSTLYNIITGGG